MIIDFIVIGISLAMDASAVSMSNGMSERRMPVRKSLFMALVFGIYQGIMPILGYYAGQLISGFIDSISGYIIFGIFMFLGINMILESRKIEEEREKLTVWKILTQGLATSIDALIIGVTFALVNAYIYEAALIIALTTFLFSIVSVYIGRSLGNLLKNKAELIGGIILIVMAIRELLEIL